MKEKIRMGTMEDTAQILAIYDRILTMEEQKMTSIGWKRGIYPTERTIQEALREHELFVMEGLSEETGSSRVVGAARINHIQVPEYAQAHWEYPDIPDEEVLVLHTLVIDPVCSGKGYGTAFVEFYENYAKTMGCRSLRMDTNEKNIPARRLYHRLGFSERGIIPCVFQGIEGVWLVCLEKKI